jgi:hypothetical protein
MAEKRTIELEIQDNSKSLKAQYKEAVLEVQKLAEKFGETSVQVAQAAKRAAELKDKIEDVNDAIQAQKGEGTFIALGKSISSVASGFSAVEGAMGLVGAQSEDVQKAMLRVQSAMALAQGLEGLEDAGRAFSQLGAVIKNTTLFQMAYNFVQTGSIKATVASTVAKTAETTATVAQGAATVGVTTATTGATRATGSTGSTGATGPGVTFTNGTNYSDYVYWNGTSWQTDSTKVHIGANAGFTGQGDYAIDIGAYLKRTIMEN